MLAKAVASAGRRSDSRTHFINVSASTLASKYRWAREAGSWGAAGSGLLGAAWGSWGEAGRRAGTELTRGEGYEVDEDPSHQRTGMLPSPSVLGWG